MTNEPRVNDSFRRHAALELLKTMLLCPEDRRHLWDRYLLDRRECSLAVDLADDLVKELERVR